ncbi:2OG-Fe(II) oxygenase [Sphingopyxis sp. 2PD]|uniref:2OG-Fe(II) oxygenase n=1 Tax=Sphingopyxis sp. 2PD TaxID=2502196 RepID=UPI0020161229|nr:2OG-Fe(II) oxygenase [Sphingopyxis sp. 2PD]
MQSSNIVERANALLDAGRAQAAVDLLIDAAKRGYGDALYELALWHVYGTPVPRSFAAARALFEKAGAAGHRGGTLTHAVFVAIGAGGPADWGAALNLLDKAAKHDPDAARQRELLAAMALTPTGDPASTSPVETLATSPTLGVVRGLLTPDECAHIMALSAPRLVPSIVVDSTTGREIPHPIRTSEGTVLGPIQQDLVIHAIDRRIAAATRTRAEQGEPLTVLRYAPGQQYRLHHDCLPGESNQRVMTAIAYLNDDYDGGATQFPSVGVEFRGQTGDMILFANTLSDGQVDERSRHAGLPVTRGEKWISTRWIRIHDFDPWGMRPV